MRWARLIALCLLAGGIASLVGGFCTAVVVSAMLSLSQGEPLAFMPGSLFLGFLGAILGLRAFIPVTVLGGLLWSFRVRSKLAWAGTGVVGALGMYGMAAVYPDLAGGMIGYLGPSWQVALAFALSGVPTAFAFRLVMESFTAFDDDAPMLD
jgi:hypothetical protein